MKFLILPLMFLIACSDKPPVRDRMQAPEVTTKDAPTLPPPDTSHDTKNFSRVIGWPEGKTPLAPSEFKVLKFASGLRNPRWIYVAPNGDIFVSEASTEFKNRSDKKEAVSTGKVQSQNMGASANRITLFRDENGDGQPELQKVFLAGLKQPFGMLVMNNHFYVANTDGVWRYPYKAGQNEMKAKGKKILTLPAGGYNNHWTRNLIASPDQKKIYISVGSASNIAEHGMNEEKRRANILEINPDGSSERVFASGLRNPVGMGFSENVLWTAVNERDNLGDNLVPDYLTSVKEGGFYGWPYSYFGPNEDPRIKDKITEEIRRDLVNRTIVPEVTLGSHTASLGLAFYQNAKAFPSRYHGGAFIGQHGSWNRTEFSGYRVAFVPFRNGEPSGPAEDFLTGFIAEKKGEVYGRPVGVTVTATGALLVADDAANTIWYVGTH